MKQILKRSVALLLILVICFGLLPAIRIVAADSEITYVTGSNGYIYNWGTRGEAATFLSPNAEEFYEDNGTSYDELSANKGGTSSSNAPQSALYDALQDLMVSNHSYHTSYSGTKDLYKFTDCQNSGGKISSFYSGLAIGPEWGSSPSWNREHTWPNSKGLGGNDENDIMMLRPTASTENSSRGNKAYGKSSGYYNPNGESGNSLDLRGDVARIFLYVYVRWGNTNGNGDYSTWGTNGVMESVSVLLEWMEADPVDTWELGRNDSVESITGTRNVFVDYPEFAFLLFGEDIPEDMTTPSGMADGSGSCNHKYVAGTPVVATCTAQGYTVYTCSLCKNSYQDNFVAALGHNYVKGTVVAATCTAEGYTVYTCSRCKISKQDDITQMLAHSYVNGVCSSCGDVKRAEGEPITVTTTVGNYASANGWTNGLHYTTLAMDNVITVTADTTKDWQYTGNYYSSGNNWRIYQVDGGQIIVSAADGATISSVKVTYTVNNGGVLTYGGQNVTSGTTVEVNDGSATFSMGNTSGKSNGQVRITAIEVSYVPAASVHEHTPAAAVKENVTTESYDSVVYCSDCGEEISRETISLIDETMTFYNVGMVLGADIRGVFQIKYKPATSPYTSFKVMIERNGVKSELPLTTSSGTSTVYLGYALNLSAKEMADEVTATIIGITADGTEYISNAYTWSIKQGAIAMLDARAGSTDAGKQAQSKLIANMLNYGAQAQQNFGYNLENLATDGLKAEYAALILDTTPEINGFDKPSETGFSIKMIGTPLNLASKVEILPQFYLPKNPVYSDYKAVVVQTHIKSDGTTTTKTMEFAGEDCLTSGRYLAPYINDLAAAELRDTLTITLYQGDKAVSATYTFSAESACSSMISSYPELIPALMNYGDCAYAVFG